MRVSFFLAALAVTACGASPAPERTAAPLALRPASTEAPAGRYTLDRTHASLLFRVDHLGFSKYTGRFRTFDATLDFAPTDPAQMKLDAAVDARSLALENPPPGFEDEIRGPQWIDAINHPTITFRSTKVSLTGRDTARVDGDFTMRGVTKPVTLDVRFNGGYAGHPMDPNGRIGFSASGTLSRSDFGVTYGIPEPGSTMGVGDLVEIIIEAEFTGPPLRQAP